LLPGPRQTFGVIGVVTEGIFYGFAYCTVDNILHRIFHTLPATNLVDQLATES
jgi:hypothetical protein